MAESFVNQLRARGDSLALAPAGAQAITVRVEMAEIWDVVKADIAPDQPVSVLKAAALAELALSATPAEYVMKLHGWEVLDETVSIRDSGASQGSTFFIAYRKRRPVR